MISDPFLISSILYALSIQTFLLYENWRICLVLSQKGALALFLLFIDLVAVFTTQEEISHFLANKGPSPHSPHFSFGSP